MGGTRSMPPGLSHSGVQVSGGGMCGRRLRGVLLCLPQFGHGGGKGDQVRDERDRGERAVPGDVASQRDEPGGSGAVRLHARALGPWFAGTADTAMLRRAGLIEGDAKQAALLDALTGAPRPARMADSF